MANGANPKKTSCPPLTDSLYLVGFAAKSLEYKLERLNLMCLDFMQSCYRFASTGSTSEMDDCPETAWKNSIDLSGMRKFDFARGGRKSILAPCLTAGEYALRQCANS